MNNEIRVSIITVCFNSEKTIIDTFNSILSQTYQNIEYIVVDGKSSDKTIDFIKEYEEKFKNRGINFIWISEKDTGIYNAMNKGIKLATGKIIGIINSDDWYGDKTIENIIGEYALDKANILTGNMLLVDDNKKEVLRILRDKNSLKKMKYRMMINHPCTFVEKEIYDKYGWFDERFKIAGDYELMSRFYEKKLSFRFINKNLVFMRLGGVSTSRKFYVKLLKENFQVRKRYYSLIDTYYFAVIDMMAYLLRIIGIKR